MNRKIYATRAFTLALKKQRDPDSVLEKIQLLAQNPRHPSLNVHQTRWTSKTLWTYYASDNACLLYEFDSEALYLWVLGSRSVIRNRIRYLLRFSADFYEFNNSNNEYRKSPESSEDTRDAEKDPSSLTATSTSSVLTAIPNKVSTQHEEMTYEDWMALYREIKPHYSDLSRRLADL